MPIFAVCVTQGYAQDTNSTKVETIFTAKSKIEISQIQITSASEYIVTRNTDDWLMIRFKQPTVPVWVSQTFLQASGSRVTVTASVLNARLRPSLDAPVLMGIVNGHSSEVLATRDGFAQIKAPSSLVVALRKQLLPTADAQQGSATSAPGSSPASEATETAPATTEVAQSAVDGAQSQTDSQNKDGAATVISDVDGVDNVGAEKVAREDTVIPRAHILAPGDAISVQIFGEPDLSISNARIPENGQISFPLIGSMTVAGSTTQTVENRLIRKYAQGYVRNPKLSVTIFSYRPIFIRGGVRNTGAFPYTEGLTVAKALALAGGTKNSAKRDGISILRDGATIESGLALDSQYLVSSGDVITLAEEEGVSDEATAFIYLHGEVNVAGEYLYRKDLTVEKAIVLAGGFSLRASRRKVSVTRYVDGQDEPQKFKRVKMFFPVKPGDIINVGARLF